MRDPKAYAAFVTELGIVGKVLCEDMGEDKMDVIDNLLRSLRSFGDVPRSSFEVANLCCGLHGEKHTLKQVGKKFGVTYPRIRSQLDKICELLSDRGGESRKIIRSLFKSKA